MNIPQLTAYIGENANEGEKNEFSSLIKSINTRSKKDNDLFYIVYLVFDLRNKEINFKVQDEFKDEYLVEYYYFGNNSAAAAQYYLTRSTNSLKYLLGRVWSDLYQTLTRYDMQGGELGRLLMKLANEGYIFIEKKDGWGIGTDKLRIIKEQPGLELELIPDKNSILLKEPEQVESKNISYESFIRLFIKDENKHNRFVLIVPVVQMENGEEVILPTHEDYLELVKIVNNLGTSSSVNNKEEEQGKVCYLCGRIRHDVSSTYSTKLSRSGINKIFTTTTINTSPYLYNFDYDNVYATCQECYQKLLAGEKIISQRFRGEIAGEDVFIIPEGLFSNFNYNYLYKLKKGIDLAFEIGKADEWIKQLEVEVFSDQINQYTLNFIFYRSDGNSVTILETIEDVPVLRFKRILEKLGEAAFKLGEHLRSMSIGHIYRIIPVRINRKGEQQDIGRVLSLYKALLNGEQIKKDVLFGYAVEALDKGLRRLSKEKIDNYFNLNLDYYHHGYEDYYIKQLIMRYLVLFHTCQEFGILDQKIFRGGDMVNEEMLTGSEKVNKSIQNMESFLNQQGFDKEARTLFYVGVLLNRVAVAQWLKNHKTKPVLRKMQFQGMNQKEVIQLYYDLLEKLRQYDKWTLFSEAIMNKFHQYFGGDLSQTWPLSELANVFYIMAGYAYMVGNKAPDLTSEEEKAQEDLVPEEDKL